MEARQNNFNEARSFANEAVADYTADLRFEYERYNDFVDMNMDLLDSLGAEYKEFVEGERQAILQKLTIEEQDKRSVMDLSLKYPKAGITINDTLEEATKKASEWSGAQPAETTSQIIGSAETGYFNIIRDAQGNIISQEPIEGIGGTAKTAQELQNEIDMYARDLLSGAIGVTSVPANIRTAVMTRKKELLIEDITDVILTNKEFGDYGTREDLINNLSLQYPQISKQEIKHLVYKNIPNVLRIEEWEESGKRVIPGKIDIPEFGAGTTPATVESSFFGALNF